MKFYNSLLALCMLQPNVWEAAGFIVNAPKRSNVWLKSSALDKPEPPANRNIMEQLPQELIQGAKTIRTWTMPNACERAQVLLTTDGRPLNADVEIWQGPNYTPHTLKVYVEDGALSPFRAIIKFPPGSNTVAVRNIGSLEYPLAASCQADIQGPAGLEAVSQGLMDMGQPDLVQGAGALRTYSFPPNVASVQVLLKTEGKALKTRIELLQGPNNKKQLIDVFCSGGNQPFFAVFETPGEGNVIRIINTHTVEFPFTAFVEPYLVDPDFDPDFEDGGLLLNQA